MWGCDQALCRHKCSEAFGGCHCCAKRPLTGCESDLEDHTVIPTKHKDCVCVCWLNFISFVVCYMPAENNKTFLYNL